MVTYDFRCATCNHRFEAQQSVDGEPPIRCPECDGECERLISAPGVRFEGGGWADDNYTKRATNGN